MDVGNSLSLLQSQRIAEESISQSHSLFAKELSVLRRQHDARLEVRTRFFFEQVGAARLRHTACTNLKNQIDTKEAVYDSWQQHNEIYQSRIVTAMLLFGCSYSSIADGNQAMPAGTPSHLLVLFSIFVSLGIALMFACLLCLLVLYRRQSKFDINNRFRRCDRCHHAHVHFHQFFECSCSKLDRASLVLFYSGSLVTFGGAVILQIMKYVIVYTATNSFAVSALLICLGGVGFCVGSLGHLVWASNTHMNPANVLSPLVEVGGAPF